jgi:hypothetical protein
MQSDGVKAALDAVMELREESPLLDQAGLFDELSAGEIGALDAPSPFSSLHAPRKGGRTKGAKNRRTEETTRWLLAQARHPVLVMMEAYSCSPVEFARRIGLREGGWVQVKDEEGKFRAVWSEGGGYSNELLMEIAKLQMAQAAAAARYVAQPQPMAVQVNGAVGLALSIEGVSVPARGGLAGGGPVIEGEGLAVNLPQVGSAKSETEPTD